jgi:hypothetical protein
MTKVGSLSTYKVQGSSTHIYGHISQNENRCILYEHPNVEPKIRNIWLPINPLLLGGFVKLFKPKYNNEFKEGDKVIRVELSKFDACVLRWKLYKNGEKVLVWGYASFDNTTFSNNIKGNMLLELRMEEYHIMNSTKN